MAAPATNKTMPTKTWKMRSTMPMRVKWPNDTTHSRRASEIQPENRRAIAASFEAGGLVLMASSQSLSFTEIWFGLSLLVEHVVIKVAKLLPGLDEFWVDLYGPLVGGKGIVETV